MKKDSPVTFAVFIWAFGLSMILFGWIFLKFNTVDAEINKEKEVSTDIRLSIESIKTNVEWIRKTLENN